MYENKKYSVLNLPLFCMHIVELVSSHLTLGLIAFKHISQVTTVNMQVKHFGDFLVIV